MKKLILLICASVLSAAAVHAQSGKRSVEAADIELIRTGGQVTVSFTLHAGKKATRANYNLVVNPVIRSGATRRQLPSIVIRGRRSKVTDARHELATGERRYEQTPVYTSPGTSLDYTAALPYESWMSGGELLLEGVSVGCCSATEVGIGPIAANILHAEPVVETKVVEVPVVVPRRSTGEHLAEQYPFIAPVSELERIKQAPAGTDYNMPLDLGGGMTAPRGATARTGEVERIIAAAREGSISIFFAQGRRVIDRNFGSNNRNLVELISAVRALAAAGDVRVARIVIAGFASPEGAAAANERLAWDRAMAVKEFLASNSGIDPAVVQVYNGGVDWTGLRELIEKSDIYQKRRMMDIIDYTPVWDPYRNVGRLGELMRVDGGDPYRYMVREFFPQLRQAAYIKVYYENK